MANAAKKNGNLLATGGGNAPAGGVTMQASVAAWAAVQLIRGTVLDARWRLGAAKPLSIRLETEVPVDDILIETDAGGHVFIQVKNTLKGGNTLKSELGKTCDEIARLWQLTEKGSGVRDWDRPLTDGKDIIVIAIGPKSSGTLKVDLTQALRSLRMKSTATLAKGPSDALSSFRALLRHAFDKYGVPASLDLDSILKFVHVTDFDFGGPHREAAEAKLAVLLEDPDAAPAAFRVIEGECQDAMTEKGAEWMVIVFSPPSRRPVPKSHPNPNSRPGEPSRPIVSWLSKVPLWKHRKRCARPARSCWPVSVM